jgi:protein-S-isoprenylcysteine O-methyltransferase Ste14
MLASLVGPTDTIAIISGERFAVSKSKSRMSTTVWVVASASIAAEAVLCFFLYNKAGSSAIRTLGWIVWGASCVFGWWTIFLFRRKGGAPSGKSWVHTAAVVEDGIYAVMRHPQYFSFCLIGLALALIAQHWLIGVLGLAAMASSYLIARDADRVNLEKFGDDYLRYMERVPRWNFLAGILRLQRRRRAHR